MIKTHTYNTTFKTLDYLSQIIKESYYDLLYTDLNPSKT